MPPQKSPDQDFRKVLELIARKKGSLLEVFTDFVCMAACAYSLQTREEEYLSVAGKYSREELDDFAKAMAFMTMEMEADEFADILGPYYAEVNSKFTRDTRGEFYTPPAINKVMAGLLVDVDQVVADGKPITINEPTCGSGGIILSLAENFAAAGAVDLMRVTAQDIAKVACDMAYINLTLYGVPSRIIWGDTLRMTVNQKWENLHWHRVGEPLRKQVRAFSELLNSPPPAKPKIKGRDESGPSIVTREDDGGQQAWDFDF